MPRLRGQGYCPVYVRIDYSREAPEPAEQIKRAISRTARHSGEWTRQGVAAAGESLWEFLHHRDDTLRDESGAELIPLLIFDQFEEIFTLAQSDDFGRARAARFIEELADLVENRPPKALEARLESDDAAAEAFDFARSDYRVLIALREDYLAPLEGLKKSMPSIAQNRLRLAPIVRLGEPDLELMRAVLFKLFSDRQLAVDPPVVNYLVLRLERSLDAARAIVEMLDREALARGKPVTRALAAEILRDEGEAV